MSTAAECKASSVLMIHEKFTCAYLSVKHLGIPSIGLSGCQNWRKDGGINPDLRDVLVNMPADSTVYMCLDGDINDNPTVNNAARSFLGYMESLRPDITVIFPMVPVGFGGWDDWAVAQDDIAGKWILELNAQRVDVTSLLTLDVLINVYGLAYKADKDDNIIVLHTTDNYIKLFQHPRWTDYVLSIDDMMYDKNDPSTPLEYEDVARKLEIWLTQCVFRGAAAERVSGDKCLKAVKEAMQRPERRLGAASGQLCRVTHQQPGAGLAAQSRRQSRVGVAFRVVQHAGEGERDGIEVVFTAARDVRVLQPAQRGIERPFLDDELVSGAFPEPAGDGVPMGGAPAQGLEDEHVEGALEEAELFVSHT